MSSKSFKNASDLRPLNGRKFILPGQYTKPSIFGGNSSKDNESSVALKVMCFTFLLCNPSFVLEATMISDSFGKRSIILFPIP